jgi:hypothetical protein
MECSITDVRVPEVAYARGIDLIWETIASIFSPEEAPELGRQTPWNNSSWPPPGLAVREILRLCYGRCLIPQCVFFGPSEA